VTAAPEITVCVPAYLGEAFVGNTLASLARQTHRGFRVLVSVDPSPDGTLAICRTWESDPRFRVIAQPVRLGWPENVNWLLERVTTPRLCIMPHDDWVEPDYLSRLSAVLDAEPGAVVAYTDILLEINGQALTADSLTGDPCRRMCSFLTDTLNAVPWRGLIRTGAALATDLLQDRAGGFAADTLWLLELCALGGFLRVPGLSYHKRSPSGSVTGGWSRWPPGVLEAHWMDHHADCLRTALVARPWSASQRQAIAAAAVVRAANMPPLAPPADIHAIVRRMGDLALCLASSGPELALLPDPDAEVAEASPETAAAIVARLRLAGG